MGTKGRLTIVCGNKTINTYVHMDAYPTGLGNKIVSDIMALLQVYDIEAIIAKFEACKVVTDGTFGEEGATKPSSDDLIDLIDVTNENAPDKSNWYFAAYKLQGELLKMLDVGYLIKNDTNDFWFHYIVNWDNKFLTIIANGLPISSNTFGIRNMFIEDGFLSISRNMFVKDTPPFVAKSHENINNCERRTKKKEKLNTIVFPRKIYLVMRDKDVEASFLSQKHALEFAKFLQIDALDCEKNLEDVCEQVHFTVQEISLMR